MTIRKFRPSEVFARGSWRRGRKVKVDDIRSLRDDFSQKKAKWEKLRSQFDQAKNSNNIPQGLGKKVDSARDDLVKSQDNLDAVLYDRKKYNYMNRDLGKAGGITLAAILAHQGYKRYNAKGKGIKTLKDMLQRNIKPTGAVAGTSGLAYLGTRGLNKEASVVETPLFKFAYSDAHRGRIVTERPVYDMDDKELERRHRYEKGERGFRTAVGGASGTAVGGLLGLQAALESGATSKELRKAALKYGLIGAGTLGAVGAIGGNVGSRLREWDVNRERKRRKRYNRKMSEREAIARRG